MRTATLFLILASLALGAPLNNPTINTNTSNLDRTIAGVDTPKDLRVDCDMREARCRSVNNGMMHAVNEFEGHLGKQGGIVAEMTGNILEIEGQKDLAKSTKANGKTLQYDLQGRAHESDAGGKANHSGKGGQGGKSKDGKAGHGGKGHDGGKGKHGKELVVDTHAGVGQDRYAPHDGNGKGKHGGKHAARHHPHGETGSDEEDQEVDIMPGRRGLDERDECEEARDVRRSAGSEDSGEDDEGEQGGDELDPYSRGAIDARKLTGDGYDREKGLKLGNHVVDGHAGVGHLGHPGDIGAKVVAIRAQPMDHYQEDEPEDSEGDMDDPMERRGGERGMAEHGYNLADAKVHVDIMGDRLDDYHQGKNKKGNHGNVISRRENNGLTGSRPGRTGNEHEQKQEHGHGYEVADAKVHMDFMGDRLDGLRHEGYGGHDGRGLAVRGSEVNEQLKEVGHETYPSQGFKDGGKTIEQQTHAVQAGGDGVEGVGKEADRQFQVFGNGCRYHCDEAADGIVE